MPRIAVARFWHEANSFSPLPTTRADVVRREWVTGGEVVPRYRGTATEIGAAIAFAAAHRDIEMTFLRCAAAPPGGPMAQEVVDEMIADIAGGLAGGSFDGVYLSLHGASIAAADVSPELTLLSAVRDAAPRALVAASFDLHANLPLQAAALLDIATGYRTYPHIDMAEAGSKALTMLRRALEAGVRPVVALAHADVVLPSFRMRTADEPMAAIEALARGLETGPVWDATPLGGFAYADVPHAGAGAIACGTEREAVTAAAARVAGALRVRRADFAPVVVPPAEAIALALARAAGRAAAVLEPSDNPLSGGAGDTPGLFAALLAAQPPPGTVFAFFCDPALVAAAHAAGAGASLDVRLGARLTCGYGAPVPWRGTVRRLTDGRFVNEGPMERGLAVDIGPTALLEADGLSVIVTTTSQSPNDQAYLALHGLDASTIPLLAAKAKNHFRAAFESLFPVIVEADTPGPASADVAALPFRRVPRERLP